MIENMQQKSTQPVSTLPTTVPFTRKLPNSWVHKVSDMPYPTPFMVTNLEQAKNNAQFLKNLLSRVELYYAIKSNPDDLLLSAIDQHIEGYDIASLGELEHLLGLGVSCERILYSNPVKVPHHIRESYQKGVRYYAFDSTDEIAKLAKDAPGSNVYLRLKVDDKGSSFPLSRKFGVSPSEAVYYFGRARAAGLKPIGLTFHVGSQSVNPESWTAAIRQSGLIINRLRQAGMPVSMLNLAGGIPAAYTEKHVPVHQIARAINTALEIYIPKRIRIVAEPGRSISANTSVLVTSVIGREVRGGNEDWLFLDMGVFQGLMEALEMPSWRYPITTQRTGRLQSYVLTGPTCDAYDTLGLDYQLPSNLRINDRLCIASAGAYTTVYASNFNGFEPPKTYYLEEA